MQDARIVDAANDREHLDRLGARIEGNPGDRDRLALDERLHPARGDRLENVADRVQAAHAVENALELGEIRMRDVHGHRRRLELGHAAVSCCTARTNIASAAQSGSLAGNRSGKSVTDLVGDNREVEMKRICP